ncbi:MAG TPA: enoyl-[acyl-carrier-protein] reductase FabL [Anaerolineales bacterium]|nr:enoyl-[acyl-carrier-protein] reductase FabL [Anaerolineales bacterium]
MAADLPFQGKVALVTGSGRGIGRTIALHLAQRGADVVINFFRNRAPAEEVAEEVRAFGRQALVVKANVGEIEDIERLFASVEQTFGALDIFISNAASGYNRPVMEQKPRGWDWTMNINARALLFAAQQAVPLMRARRGSIVAISSPGARLALPDYVVVGASKAALEAVIRYLAVELAPYNINANAVSPGLVSTEALQHFAAVRAQENLLDAAAARTPAGRLVTPEDVAGVVAFLCSPQAAMIRGQTITIDGGYSLAADWFGGGGSPEA